MPVMEQERPVRTLVGAEITEAKPVYVVWEITLACNLRCQHCGSRAGTKRPDELTTEECFDVVDQLARLGTREITIIGGEAFLRKDWLAIIRHIRERGIVPGMQSGGFHLNRKRLEAAKEAGLEGVGISLDGMRDLHDRLRGVQGSWDHAINAIREAHEVGLITTVNTQIGPDTDKDLPALLEVLTGLGVKAWRFQLTVAMGNAVDNDHLLLQPYRLAELMPLIARMTTEARSRGMLCEPGNNVGFFGPYEHMFREYSGNLHWLGCAAGINVIGIEADGTIKGCPSLATQDFAAGNIRDLTMEDMWNYSERMHFARTRSVDDLWGFCRSCYYADVCRAGCTWTAHSLFGKAGNNPWCHHRVIELEKRGLRERVVKKSDAPGLPFDIGEFALITEPIPGREATQPATVTHAPAGAGPLIQIQFDPGRTIKKPADGQPIQRGRKLRRLYPCRSCNRHVFRKEATCPHCGVDAPVAVAAPKPLPPPPMTVAPQPAAAL